MSTSRIGGAPPIRPPEAVEPKGVDRVNDHDGDDGAAKPVPPAALPPGQGTIVDKKA